MSSISYTAAAIAFHNHNFEIENTFWDVLNLQFSGLLYKSITFINLFC